MMPPEGVCEFGHLTPGCSDLQVPAPTPWDGQIRRPEPRSASVVPKTNTFVLGAGAKRTLKLHLQQTHGGTPGIPCAEPSFSRLGNEEGTNGGCPFLPRWEKKWPHLRVEFPSLSGAAPQRVGDSPMFMGAAKPPCCARAFGGNRTATHFQERDKRVQKRWTQLRDDRNISKSVSRQRDRG